jgi:hypothetical protein
MPNQGTAAAGGSRRRATYRMSQKIERSTFCIAIRRKLALKSELFASPSVGSWRSKVSFLHHHSEASRHCSDAQNISVVFITHDTRSRAQYVVPAADHCMWLMERRKVSRRTAAAGGSRRRATYRMSQKIERSTFCIVIRRKLALKSELLASPSVGSWRSKVSFSHRHP